ncbi:hypothetical protein BJV78DRAFT_1365328 [Lactifluus subvellereus]|nr:hypothetical protein BJV78DRAFT_1365328 [Lactifluus subvellereus]
MHYSDGKKEYWYKQKAGKPGKQLPAKYKRMFANKQIVRIEYMEISEDDELGVYNLRPPLHGRLSCTDSSLSLGRHSLGFNDQRDAAFRWVAQSLQTIIDPRPLIKRTTTTASQQTTWLKDTAPLVRRGRSVCNTRSSYSSIRSKHIRVSRGPATIAPIDLVMMVLLVFGFQDKLSASWVADALRALRMSARKETNDLMCKSEYMGYYVVFLGHLERMGEAVLGSSSAQDAQVPMDINPLAKRQRTGAQSQPPPLPPPTRTTSTSQRTPTSYNSQPQPQPQLHPSQPTMLRLMVIVPPSPSASITAPTPTTRIAFAAQPLPKTDRLAAMRAAKAAIQGAQQQQQPQLHGSHGLPPRPAQAQLPRPTASTSANWPETPMSGSAGGSSSGGIGGASGGDVEGRK